MLLEAFRLILLVLGRIRAGRREWYMERENDRLLKGKEKGKEDDGFARYGDRVGDSPRIRLGCSCWFDGLLRDHRMSNA